MQEEDIRILLSKANEVLNNLSNSFKIESVDKKNKQKQSKPPFTTSTMQQDASSKLNFNAKKTMQIAQKLYEGIELEDETVGLISYMRTDSIRLSDDFVKSTYSFIEAKYGKEYIGSVKVSKKKDNVQDAHEGIRPTSINRTPESVKKFLSNDEYKLYRLIYYRALASLMKSATTINTTVILDNNNYQFKATGQIIDFDGYLKVYKDYENSEDISGKQFEGYNADNEKNIDELKNKCYEYGTTHFMETTSGEISPTELVVALINQKDTLLIGFYLTKPSI